MPSKIVKTALIPLTDIQEIDIDMPKKKNEMEWLMKYFYELQQCKHQLKEKKRELLIDFFYCSSSSIKFSVVSYII